MTRRQRRALHAICETFAPRLDGWPSAEELGVPDAIAEAAALRGESQRLARLLTVWDALAAPGRRRFSALPPERREAALLAWCDSRVTQRRTAFQALRKAVLTSYYLAPDNPAWRRIGYAGPPGPPANGPLPRTLAPLAVDRDAELECDVCVVGSGAGGGTAAAVLAAAGLDVVVLEAGEYLDDEDFDGGELEGFRRLYLDGGTAATDDHGIVLLAGTCLGGGTVVNYTTSFRTPDEVRAEWAAAGVPAFAGSEYDRSLDAVWARLGVNLEHSRPSRRDQKFQEGLESLGWHVGRIARNVRGCDQGRVCGCCPYGCRLGAKQSAVKTWLADAQAAGTRILVRTRAERVRVERGAAVGVDALTADGRPVAVRSRAVVVACGALETPVLLRRSGLRNPNIGRHLRLHPVAGVAGLFDEEIRPWEGTMQAIYSDEHRDLDAGYGVKYETAAAHPSLPAALLPWRGSERHAELMTGLPHLVGIGVLLRDRDGGEVRVGGRGRPVVRYRVSPYDVRHVRAGLEGAARVLEAAGARRIVSSHSRWVAFDPARDGDRGRFLRDADACGYGPGRCLYVSFHQMGSTRMGASPGTSACDPEGTTWEARGLVVCDGSTFPTASGVNPMISIAATSHMNASVLAARLT
jgi:choline dehydrogenase-like flavoprotein